MNIYEEPVSNTCPILDSIVRDIRELDSETSACTINNVERVRAMNKSLREWGLLLVNKCVEHEHTIDKLESELNMLHRE